MALGAAAGAFTCNIAAGRLQAHPQVMMRTAIPGPCTACLTSTPTPLAPHQSRSCRPCHCSADKEGHVGEMGEGWVAAGQGAARGQAWPPLPLPAMHTQSAHQTGEQHCGRTARAPVGGWAPCSRAACGQGGGRTHARINALASQGCTGLRCGPIVRECVCVRVRACARAGRWAKRACTARLPAHGAVAARALLAVWLPVWLLVPRDPAAPLAIVPLRASALHLQIMRGTSSAPPHQLLVTAALTTVVAARAGRAGACVMSCGSHPSGSVERRVPRRACAGCSRGLAPAAQGRAPTVSEGEG